MVMGIAVGGIADQKRPIILDVWQEVCGPLHHLDHDEGRLFATIGSISVWLPPELDAELAPHQGHRICILRTDSPSRPYRVRIPG